MVCLMCETQKLSIMGQTMRLYRRGRQFVRFTVLKMRSNLNEMLQRIGVYKYKQLSDEESVDFLLNNKEVGIVRFGNSELSYVAGCEKDNQVQNVQLRKKLVDILENHPSKTSYEVGLPLDATILSGTSKRKVRRSIWDRAPRVVVQIYAKRDYEYLSAFLFRLLNVASDDKNKYVEKLKTLFEGRDIIYVGPNTGRNADIWNGIRPKEIVSIPEANAFDIFDEIKNIVTEKAQNYEKPLVLVVAGITATALSAELNENGITTYDLGQITRHVKACIN